MSMGTMAMGSRSSYFLLLDALKGFWSSTSPSYEVDGCHWVYGTAITVHKIK
jgi:hypothetical protein